MACNGYNHLPDCTCNFRGGNPGVAPEPLPTPLFGPLAPLRPKRVSRGRVPGRCDRCGMAVHFVPGRNSGTMVVGADGWLKHRCPKAVPADRPVLRNAKWRKDWSPAGLSALRKREGEQRLAVTVLAEGATHRVAVLDGLSLDVTTPAVCRWSKNDPRILEIAYTDPLSGELTGTIIQARRLRG